MWEKIWNNGLDLLIKISVITLVIFGAKLIIDIFSKYTAFRIKRAGEMKDEKKASSITTRMTLMRSGFRYLMMLGAVAVILNYLGIVKDVNSLLVTAGVGTLVISLGLQNVIKDIVAGMTLMFEQPYKVGDVIKVGEYTGRVTAIAIRNTYIQTYLGQKIIIPNGKVEDVVNYNTQFNGFVTVVPTPYERSAEEMISVLQRILEEFYETHTDIFVEKPVIQGVVAFNESSVDIGIYGKVLPMCQWKAERELRLAIKKRFDELGISIPYKQIVIHND